MLWHKLFSRSKWPIDNKYNTFPFTGIVFFISKHFSVKVRVYTSDGVVNELERAKLEYLQASIIVTSGKKIGLPELLLRNMNDFAPDLERLVEWLCQQLPTSGTLGKSMVDCFRVNNAKVTSIVEKLPYEFEFQYLLPM